MTAEDRKREQWWTMSFVRVSEYPNDCLMALKFRQLGLGLHDLYIVSTWRDMHAL